MRALARDLGRVLGCLGHVTALRRTRVGPFTEEAAIDVADIEALSEAAASPGPLDLAGIVLPVQVALNELDSVAVTREAANRLMRGQPVILRGRDAPTEGQLFATLNGLLVAVGHVENGELVPHRVFNLGA